MTKPNAGATPETVAPSLRRILAPNPSPMTAEGTNTWLLGTRGLAVIDPGPDDPAHLATILAAVGPGQRITHIIVTHAHRDHSALAPALSRATGAPVLAFGDARAGRRPLMEDLARRRPSGSGEGVDTGFRPDRPVADGERITGDGWMLDVLHTPGHFGNHICLVRGDEIFSGDHVMGWSTSIVAPPDGDMAAYMASLDRLAQANGRRLYPGHGAPVEAPRARIDALRHHRHERAAAIARELGHGPAAAETLARAIYTDIPPVLLGAATANVFAHLIEMMELGQATPAGPLAIDMSFTLSNQR